MRIYEKFELSLIKDNPEDVPMTPCWPQDEFGIIIQVHPKENGKCKAHVYDLYYNELGVILDSDDIPIYIEDIKVYSGNLSDDIKGRILNWANKFDRRSGMMNWCRIRSSWESCHK